MKKTCALLIFAIIFSIIFIKNINENSTCTTITIEKEINKYSYNFTEEDLKIINQKILGMSKITTKDLKKYDMNGDEILDIIDLVKINRLLLRLDDKCTYRKTIIKIKF